MHKLQTISALPLISVVIPCYNEELFIGDCLDSLKAQNFHGDFEIIVVDNNSSDHTAEIAKSCGVKVVSESRKGVCAARQAGTEAAQGNIIVSTDADTIFASDWLSKINKEFLKNPEVVMVSGPCKFINAPWWGLAYTSVLFGSVKIVYRLTGKVWYATGCNTAFRKKSWSGYNIRLAQGGDELGLLNDLKKRGEIKFLPDNIVFTSSRRLNKGLIYNLLVTVSLYYIFDYFIGLAVGRSIIGSYPAFRDNNIKSRYRLSASKLMTAAFVVVVVLSIVHTDFVSQITRHIAQKLSSF